MMKRRMVAALAGAALVVGLGACSDDDEDASTTTTAGEAAGEETTTSAPAEGEGEEEGEGGPPEVNPCAEGESGTLGPVTPPADGATAVEVTASEYTFAGLDALSAPGEYGVTLVNDGAELHELVIQRINDDETRPLEELLQEEDPSGFVTDVAFTFACPGASAEAAEVNIEEPGRYVALCFIPVGTVPETPPEEFEQLGPPHAFQGMAIEFQVS
jgi:hypothetical protein